MAGRGDHSSVYAGRYPYPSRPLSAPSGYDAEIARQRGRIEERPELMNTLAAELYPDERDDPGRVTFRYRGASLNEESEELVLWYMGPIRSPDINAGYRAQWVLDLKKEYLTSVYLSLVPLE